MEAKNMNRMEKMLLRVMLMDSKQFYLAVKRVESTMAKVVKMKWKRWKAVKTKSFKREVKTK